MPKSQSTVRSEPSEQEHKTEDEMCIMQSDTCAQLQQFALISVLPLHMLLISMTLHKSNALNSMQIFKQISSHSTKMFLLLKSDGLLIKVSSKIQLPKFHHAKSVNDLFHYKSHLC